MSPSPTPSSPPIRSLPTAPPAAASPSPPASPSSPPAALTPPDLSLSHPPQSPSYASRSLGRNVIVSGIEFEPALPIPPLAEPFGDAAEAFRAQLRKLDAEGRREAEPNLIGVFGGEGEVARVETPSREEMREFFGPSASSSSSAPASVDLPTLPTSHWPPPPPPPSHHAASAKQNTSAAKDSEDDVSARWSALVEQAEQRASRMGVGKVDLWGSSSEGEEELSESEGEEQEEGEEPTTEPQSPQAPPPNTSSSPELAPPSPPATSPPPPTSSILYRLGLGTSTFSLAEGRPPLGRQPSLGAKLTAKGPLGRVQDWIRNGAGDALNQEEEATWYIEVCAPRS